ncbi:MAG: HAD family phosphatase [Candidatus Micrarchaeia archaeon]
MAKAVIFDFDGVLADTREAGIAAYKQALAEAGYAITKDEIRRFWGQGPFLLIKRFFDYKGLNKSASVIERIAKRKTLIQARMAGRNKLTPGARPLLRALRKTGMRIGLATSNRLALVKAFLRHYGLTAFFDAVTTTEAGDRPKPSPDLLLRTARRLGAKPSACTVIEDSAIGIKAARNAGMCVIGVATGFEPRVKLARAGADLLVRGLGERKKILRFLSTESL